MAPPGCCHDEATEDGAQGPLSTKATDGPRIVHSASRRISTVTSTRHHDELQKLKTLVEKGHE
jgi:hypothetical protein